MKNLSISRDSWLFKLALYGGLEEGWSRTDFCSLFWHCVWGLLRAPFWAALFGCLGAGVLFFLMVLPIIELIVWFTVGVVVDPSLVFLQGFVWAVLIFGAYSFWVEYKGRTNLIVAPLGVAIGSAVSGVRSFAELVRAGYRGWKNKTCVMIDVVGEVPSTIHEG